MAEEIGGYVFEAKEYYFAVVDGVVSRAFLDRSKAAGAARAMSAARERGVTVPPEVLAKQVDNFVLPDGWSIWRAEAGNGEDVCVVLTPDGKLLNDWFATVEEAMEGVYAPPKPPGSR